MTERKAGRELDAIIAEKLMGYQMVRVNSRVKELRLGYEVVVRYEGKNVHYIGYQKPHLPAYSTDIAAAWQVLEKLQADGWTVTLAPRQFEKYPEDRFKFHGCRVVGTPQTMQSFSDHAETAPLAICLGALAALEATQ